MNLKIVLSVALLSFLEPEVRAQPRPGQANASQEAAALAVCAVFAHHSGQEDETDRLMLAASQRALDYARERFGEEGFEPAGIIEQFGPEYWAGYHVAYGAGLAQLTLEGSVAPATDMESAVARIDELSTTALELFEQRACDEIGYE